MSSFEILERYNDYSNDLINESPKVRANGIRKMLGLYFDAPELKISILTKLEQASGDTDEKVANLATQMIKIIQSGRRYSPYAPTGTDTTFIGTDTAGPAQNVKNIVANVVCCIVFIIIYFVLTYVVF